MTESPQTARPAAAPAVQLRNGHLVFAARRPTMLVVPLALITEAAGVLFFLSGLTSLGIFACGAPVLALLLTGVVLRPTLELTREGVLQRHYPFTSLTRWEAVEHFALTRAGNRIVLAYKLRDGVPAPRRQPVAALLRAAALPYDGGYFADSLRAKPEAVLAVVERYLGSDAERAGLPAARR